MQANDRAQIVIEMLRKNTAGAPELAIQFIRELLPGARFLEDIEPDVLLAVAPGSITLRDILQENISEENFSNGEVWMDKVFSWRILALAGGQDAFDFPLSEPLYPEDQDYPEGTSTGPDPVR